MCDFCTGIQCVYFDILPDLKARGFPSSQTAKAESALDGLTACTACLNLYL